MNELDEPSPFLRELQIPKSFAWSEDPDEKVQEAFERPNNILGNRIDPPGEIKTIPDFIIHKSQEHKNQIDQFLIAEVKTEMRLPYSRFAWDFFKLNLFLEKFRFQTACFLTINSSVDTIKEYISQYLNEGHYLAGRPHDLFLIVKVNFESEVVTRSLINYRQL